MSEPERWYVSYLAKSNDGHRVYARATQTFETEEHAKTFVKERAANRIRLTDGTIDSHSPKRIIATAEIAAWVETPE
jgi:hypothetical protein